MNKTAVVQFFSKEIKEFEIKCFCAELNDFFFGLKTFNCNFCASAVCSL